MPWYFENYFTVSHFVYFKLNFFKEKFSLGCQWPTPASINFAFPLTRAKRTWNRNWSLEFQIQKVLDLSNLEDLKYILYVALLPSYCAFNIFMFLSQNTLKALQLSNTEFFKIKCEICSLKEAWLSWTQKLLEWGMTQRPESSHSF